MQTSLYSPEEAIITHTRYSPVRWGAILGGWFVSMAAALLLYTLGTAIGISAISFTDMEALSRKTVFLSVFWVMVTWIVALYLGGYFAGALSNDFSKRTGTLSGVGVWAFSTVLTAVVGTAGIGAMGAAGISMAQGAGKVVGGGIMAASPFAAQAKDKLEKAPLDFQIQIRDAVDKARNTGATTTVTGTQRAKIDAEALAIVAGDFLRGDANAAADSLAYRTELSREEARQVVSSLDSKIREAKMRAEEAADRAALYATVLFSASILVSLLSLAAAMGGGAAGTRTHLLALEARRV